MSASDARRLRPPHIIDEQASNIHVEAVRRTAGDLQGTPERRSDCPFDEISLLLQFERCKHESGQNPSQTRATRQKTKYKDDGRFLAAQIDRPVDEVTGPRG